MKPRKRKADAKKKKEKLRGDPALVGTTIAGRYHLVRMLGDGGMGAVYKAADQVLRRFVAIKLLHPKTAENPSAVERFVREARSAAAIGHPNIIDILDFGYEGERPLLVMEYLRGRSLSEAIHEEPRFSVRRACSIATHSLAGLAAAHDRGILHRDLKPANMMLIALLGDRDFVKLCDFGFAALVKPTIRIDEGKSLTPARTLVGTPAYAAPERLRGDDRRDPRLDVYSIGVVLFEMLAGRRPFDAPSFRELAKKVRGEAPPSLTSIRKDIPKGLDKVVQKALAKRRNDRWSSAEEFASALVPFGGRVVPSFDDMPSDSFTMDLLRIRAREQTQQNRNDVPQEASPVVHELRRVKKRPPDEPRATLTDRPSVKPASAKAPAARRPAAKPAGPGRTKPGRAEPAFKPLLNDETRAEGERRRLSSEGRRAKRARFDDGTRVDPPRAREVKSEVSVSIEVEEADSGAYELTRAVVRPEHLAHTPSAPPPAFDPSHAAKLDSQLRSDPRRFAGSVSLSVLRFVARRFGERALRELLGNLPPGPQYVFNSGITTDTWVPYQAHNSLLAQIDAQLGRDDLHLVVQCGRAASEDAFELLRSIQPPSPPSEVLLREMPRVLQTLVPGIELRVSRVGRGYGRLELDERGESSLTACVFLIGFIDRSLDRFGAKDVEVNLISCPALGDDECIYEVSWIS